MSALVLIEAVKFTFERELFTVIVYCSDSADESKKITYTRMFGESEDSTKIFDGIVNGSLRFVDWTSQ